MQHRDELPFAMGYNKSAQSLKSIFCKQQKIRRQRDKAGTWALAQKSAIEKQGEVRILFKRKYDCVF